MRWFKRARRTASEDPTSIGNLLVRLGSVTLEQLKQGISYQREHPGTRLGESLIHVGAVEPQVLANVVQAQDTLRMPEHSRHEAILQHIERMTEGASKLSQNLEELAGLQRELLAKLK